jgi:MFS family permease
MARINVGRVFLGGLLAGLVAAIGDGILNQVVLKTQWEAAMSSLHLPPPSGGAIAYFIIANFLGGLLALWLYAAVRPRLGPGPKTAVIAGLFVWALSCFMALMPPYLTGMLPSNIVWTLIAWDFVEIPLAVTIGAWLYRE